MTTAYNNLTRDGNDKIQDATKFPSAKEFFYQQKKTIADKKYQPVATNKRFSTLQKMFVNNPTNGKRSDT